MRRLLISLTACLALLGLAACSDTEGTNEAGYIAGDGQVETIRAVDRGEPVELSGETLEGEPLDVADLRGKPVVVNVWWSGCGPCRTEMPMLQAVHEQLGDQVAFVGVNTRDNSTVTAQAFERHFEVEYPSLYSPDGKAVLALAREVHPATIPATIVLDPQGRAAAVIRGPIPTETTLESIIEDAAGESLTGRA